MSQQDIITQVTPESTYASPSITNSTNSTGNTTLAPGGASTNTDDADYNSLIHLNVRGKEFTITRDELMSLPESILLCLFPNGVFLDMNGQIITNLTENDVVYVNFDPQCFQYIIDVFSKAQQELESQPGTLVNNLSLSYPGTTRTQQENILETKPAIIVLREDLDFYVIPPVAGLNMEEMKVLKRGVSAELLKNKLIFSGLGYRFADQDLDTLGEDGLRLQDANVKQDNAKGDGLGPAEQHLFDMLCSSGFEVKDKWGSRSLELGKCVISSLSLVRLKTAKQRREEALSLTPTPTGTPPDSPSLTPVASQASNGNGSRSRSRSRIAQLANSASRAASRSLSKGRSKVDPNQTKLLLFWRKPARKCWWSHGWIEIIVDDPSLKRVDKLLNMKEGHADSNGKIKVKVHVRRVWTLELSVIGVQ
ncbi:conserved hypothetical protein [Lodderomyces elongisporus NRRL YB-4239]|uniref:Growth regulation protein n=1 Tax=Lodderomyces elongisporus (strain ATCC 11503 / CBS 2605 / JCM 1781 / NBRC 1676 / NRRL YB-4239) TaxID=379508 RepID=A5E7J3_LODEL|nr:conserved hypothetical protein [Lodderomyces elongisporus NRRL YB-4239]